MANGILKCFAQVILIIRLLGFLMQALKWMTMTNLHANFIMMVEIKRIHQVAAVLMGLHGLLAIFWPALLILMPVR